MSETTITEQQNPAGQAAAAGEPSLIPLNALFADDFLQILVPVMSNQTVGDLADAVASTPRASESHHGTGRRSCSTKAARFRPS